MSRPIDFRTLPNDELRAANTSVLVLNTYTTAMALDRGDRKAVEAAISAWRERNPDADPKEASLAVAKILSDKLSTRIANGHSPSRRNERHMTQSSTLVVRIEMPGKTLGAAMSEVRLWLDMHKIQPASFNSKPCTDGVVFDIRFAREHEAHLFERAFT